MRRVIVHLDADAFFASVEQAADSRLRGKPVAVGGEKRGIIASASYEARKMGIYTPMPTARARKLCPKLILLPGDFEKYEKFSRWMFSYAYDFTPDVEIASIDEGYFDLSGVRKPPVEVAQTIRRAIGQSLKISVSEGIGSSKLVSQIAAKLRKPAAFECVPSGQEIPFLHPLPNRWLPGVGGKTADRLNSAGLALIGQVAITSLDLLNLLLGKRAEGIRRYANGLDERPIIPVSDPAKSYSQQETFNADTTDEEYCEAVLRRMADNLMAKVREDGKTIRTVMVKVRYNDMAEDQCGESLVEPTDLETDIYGRIGVLFRAAWKRRVVTCGLVIEQRRHHQVTGEMMKFLTLANRTGIVETELFASTYRSYGLATVRYPVLEVEATVEPFENGRGFSLRVLRAGRPRQQPDAPSSKVGLPLMKESC